MRVLILLEFVYDAWIISRVMVTRLEYWYFENENNNRKKDSESVEPTQVVPNSIIFLIGHPRARHEDKEYDIHDDEHNDESKDLE